jgi:hypothetical protein
MYTFVQLVRGIFSLIGAIGYARPISNQVVGELMMQMKLTK